MLSIQELRSSSAKDLKLELKKAHDELVKIKMGLKTKNSKDSSLAKKQKTFIARIETVLKEIELEEKVKNADKI